MSREREARVLAALPKFDGRWKVNERRARGCDERKERWMTGDARSSAVDGCRGGGGGADVSWLSEWRRVSVWAVLSCRLQDNTKECLKNRTEKVRRERVRRLVRRARVIVTRPRPWGSRLACETHHQIRLLLDVLLALVLPWSLPRPKSLPSSSCGPRYFGWVRQICD